MTDDGGGALPEMVGVVGGGRMGSGIAHAFLTRGCRVVLVEADADRTAAARQSVTDAVRKSVERGTITADAAGVVAGLTVTTDLPALAGAGLAIEAVPEDPDLKHRVLDAIAEAVGESAVIASNTSSLSITGLAEGVSSPQRFLGLHFFNPVPASGLVEVVVGRHTSADTVTAAQRWVAALGKTAVTVTDSPGFASSRLGVLLGLEAIRMVEQGVASPADIDAAMTLGYKHPVGPLRLTDMVGLDVRLGVAEYLASTLGERFSPPQLLRDMVARGDVGRKSGRGFYDWTTDGR
ncbi:MAG TPA: 3-hydroxyacyl-CoA dehydrogenase family protein [Nakamurella sp.]|nr:3-hydroxyacyl-CoA dehydrogenase family protein [Nakamurella sp.]